MLQDVFHTINGRKCEAFVQLMLLSSWMVPALVPLSTAFYLLSLRCVATICVHRIIH